MTISLEYMAECIRQAGCDPAAQLRGYLETGNECYITRTEDARRMIGCFEPAQIEEYLRGIEKCLK